MLKENLFIISLLILASFANAQTVYIPGYSLNKFGDTTKGYFEYREGPINPEKIRFKKLISDSGFEELDVANTIEVAANGIVVFKAFTVEISMDSRKLSGLSSGIDSSHQNKTVFLRQLVSGPKLQLYSFNDKLKERYYLASGDENPEELKYITYFDAVQQSLVVEKKIYQKQLMQAALKIGFSYTEMQHGLSRLSYAASDIKAIIHQLNGTSEKDDRKLTVSKLANAPANGEKIPFDLFGGIGAEAHFLVVNSGPAALFGAKNKLQDNINPFFFLGINFYTNPYVRKTALRLEASFASANNFISKGMRTPEIVRDDTLWMKWNNITITAQLVRKFDVAKNIRFGIAAGLRVGFHSYKDGFLRSNYFNGATILTKDYKEQLTPLVGALPISLSIESHKVQLFTRYNLNFSEYTKAGNDVSQDLSAKPGFRGQSIQLGISYAYRIKSNQK